MSVHTSGQWTQPVTTPLMHHCGFDGAAEGDYDPELSTTCVFVDCPQCGETDIEVDL